MRLVLVFPIWLLVFGWLVDRSSWPAAPKAHPRLYFTQSDLAVIKARRERTDIPAYAAIAHEVMRTAGTVVDRDVPIYLTPGAWPHLYVCDGRGDGNDDRDDGCGGSLLFEEDRPYDHICPRCGKVYRGSPYDEAWISLYNDQVARHIRNLGLAYLLSDDVAFAEKAAELCRRYTRLYLSFPLLDVWGGTSQVAGRLYAQTLDESVWIFELLWGLDAIYDSPALSEDDRELIEKDFLRAIVATLTRSNLGTSNIQAWITGAIGAIGFFLEDEELIERAISGPRGYHYLVENAFGTDGFSVEGSTSYHYYALRPLLYLARIADRAGRGLWDDRMRRALVTPLHLVEPDGSFPRLNDAGLTRLRNLVGLYEMANGLSGDPVFDQVLTEVYRLQGYRRTDHFALFLGDDFDDSTGLVSTGKAPDSIGVEVLRGYGTSLPLMALLDRGPHGGWHGHDDKLNLIVFGQGRELVPDLGIGSFMAELLNGWFRRTISHNTILVGEYGQNPGPDLLSPLTFDKTSFPSVQVISVKPAYAVYPGRTKVERTVIRVESDYLIVLDTIADGQPPIDVAWHAYGRFAGSTGDRYNPTGLLDRWRSSINGYQYLRPPWFFADGPKRDILEIPPDEGPTRVVWRLPLSLSDDMEDLTLWEGECALSDNRTEGASSLRFLALPNRTVRVGKDISHPHQDFSSLRTLEFDYYLEQGQATGLSVILQHLPAYDRSAWHLEPLEPGIWHHAGIDLLNPDEILGGAYGRSRLEFAVSAVGEPEDSFFVYIDNVQARSASAPEEPLVIGLAATVLSTPAASHLLADGPGLRPGDRHPILLSRVPGKDATYLTLVEMYAGDPRWRLTASPDGTFRVSSGDVTDVVSIDSIRHTCALARNYRDGTPELLVLFNRMTGEVGSCEVESSQPIDLELQITAAHGGAVEYSYRTGSEDDSFFLRTAPPGPYSIVLFDGAPWDQALLHVGETIELGPIPGGSHRIQFVGATTAIEEWHAH